MTRCPLRSCSPSAPNCNLTPVRVKRCSVNGGVSPQRAEIERKIGIQRNHRLQRQQSPPCAAPSLEFAIATKRNETMTVGSPLFRLLSTKTVRVGKFSGVTSWICRVSVCSGAHTRVGMLHFKFLHLKIFQWTYFIYLFFALIAAVTSPVKKTFYWIGAAQKAKRLREPSGTVEIGLW